MSFFNKKNDTKLIQELQYQLTEIEAANKKLLSENSNYKRTISTFVDVKLGYEKEVTDLKSKHGIEIDKVNSELVKEKNSVNRKVNKALATMGVETFAPEEISQPVMEDSSPKGIYSKFQSLSGIEKGKFQKEHQEILTNYVMSRK
jgi:hypothetical protein